jgi:4'-phosphopantetheinyl transferase
MSGALCTFELTGKHIHVWSVSIQSFKLSTERLIRFLNPDESARASQIGANSTRDLFIAGRGVLRILLGQYLRRAPESIQVTYEPHGKPRVAADDHIQFNVTHSGDLVALAFSTDCPVGIDVEPIRELSNISRIYRYMLCPDEVAELMPLPADARERAFFHCWTRKEAYAKAIGKGLLTAFNDFCVSVHPDAPARFVHFNSDTSRAAAWSLHDLSLSPAYAAALAYPGPERVLSIFEVNDPAELFPTD